VSFLALPATLPPLFATFLFLSKVSGFSFFDISVVTRSPNIVKISSKSSILSRKFILDFLGKFLKLLYSERLDEIENPELAQERMKEIYKQKGYPKDWIDKRLRGIAIRQSLTDEVCIST
jgi:hypothetical protein